MSRTDQRDRREAPAPGDESAAPGWVLPDVPPSDTRGHDTRPITGLAGLLHRTSTRTRGTFSELWGSIRVRRGGRSLRAVELSGRDKWLWIGVDLVATLVLCGFAAIAFRLTFGTDWVWITCAGGAVLGIGIGLVAALRDLPAWMVAVGLALVYLIFGSALAMPTQATAHVLPNLRTLTALVFGVVTAWRQLLTITAPVGETQALLVVPLITMLIGSAVAVTIALRSSRPALAWIAPALATVVGIGFGVEKALWPALLAVGFVIVALVWTGYRRDFAKQALLGHERRYRWTSVLSGLGVIVLASGLAVLSQPLTAPATSRHVLRDAVTPPLQVESWPSPLQKFRANITEHKKDTIMTVTGLPKGAVIRLATLDTYDGITMNASNSDNGTAAGGSFSRIGTEVPDSTKGTKATVGITLDHYSGVWVPTVGQLRSISFGGNRAVELTDDLFYNPASGTAVDPAGVRSGDRYTLNVVVPDQPAHADIAEVDAQEIDQPAVTDYPDQLADMAQKWTANADSDGDMAIKLEAQLRRGFYSNGLASQAPSLSGHSYSRMLQLVTGKQMIGDEEQYSVAMALMARSLGLPARVVYGYRPTTQGTATITGNDVSTWCEIDLKGYGWVQFSPTPDRSRSPKSDTRTTRSKPRPHVENPPPAPHKPENPPPDNAPPQAPKQDDQKHHLNIPWALIGTVALSAGVPLVVIGAPLLAIGLLKRRRRLRRWAVPDPANRIAGGWDELVDCGRDLGVPLTATDTRSETAAMLIERFPQSDSMQADSGQAGPMALARRADEGVFSPGNPPEPHADAYWDDVAGTNRAMLKSVSWWRRFGARFSLRSLRTLR